MPLNGSESMTATGRPAVNQSFSGSAAAVLNNQFGRVILPLGKPLSLFAKD